MTNICAPTHIATGSYVSIDVATENILLSTSCFWLVDQYTVFRCGGDGYSIPYGAIKCVVNKICAPTPIPSAGYVSNEVASDIVQPASLQPINLLSRPWRIDTEPSHSPRATDFLTSTVPWSAY